MNNLYFKSDYVSPIRQGEKRDTIRLKRRFVPAVGDTVVFRVRGHGVFATALITSLTDIETLEPERLASLSARYNKWLKHEELIRIGFKVLTLEPTNPEGDKS